MILVVSKLVALHKNKYCFILKIIVLNTLSLLSNGLTIIIFYYIYLFVTCNLSVFKPV
jgi:hypothetical protein